MKRAATTDGFFDVLLETESAQAASMTLQPSQSTGGPENRHPDSDQWLYVVAGKGRATIDGTDVALAEGDLVCVEARETHEIATDGDGRGYRSAVSYWLFATLTSDATSSAKKTIPVSASRSTRKSLKPPEVISVVPTRVKVRTLK